MDYRRLRVARTAAALFLCLAAGLSAAPARAETVDVTGVAADDVLNLRTEPRSGAPLTGALSPTASGIEVVRRSDGWAFVKSGKLAGWASVRFLRPAMSFENGKPPLPLQCIGTEPFWSCNRRKPSNISNAGERRGRFRDSTDRAEPEQHDRLALAPGGRAGRERHRRSAAGVLG